MSNGKVAIITLYNKACPNFGNAFQNYACERIYELLGYTVETLVKEKPFSDFDLIKYRCYLAINFMSGYRLSSKQQLWKKYLSFSKFEKKQLHIKYVNSYKLSNTDYSYYSIGSDQVWNPNWTKSAEDMRWFFCADIDPDKIITLSPSFGINSIPQERRNEYSQMLSRIDHISVREETGREIIRELSSKETKVLIDPTLALSKDEWEVLQRKPKGFNDENYILCYFLGAISDKKEKEINQFADRNGLRLINIMDNNSELYSIDPSEFLWLLAHAQVVFTDSFHGSVFSIIYGKPFYVFRREGRNDYMFSRLETLLSKLHLEDHVIEDASLVHRREMTCDYSISYSLLQQEQKKLWDHLKKSLN